MRFIGSASKRSLVAAIAMVIMSGCGGSGTSAPATSAPATSAPATSAPASSGRPTSVPATTAAATAEPVSDLLTGGRYRFGPFGDMPSVYLVATGPKDWVGYPNWAMDGPEPVRADAPAGIGISFFTADGLYSDACHWDVRGTGQADVGDVVVGPTVGDMVAALRANTSYTSSVAKPVTIDGYAGQELELQLPADPFATCDKDDPDDSGGHPFVFPGTGLYAQGPANRWHLYIVDVHGTRLIAVILSYAKTPRADLDVARNIIQTIDINP